MPRAPHTAWAKIRWGSALRRSRPGRKGFSNPGLSPPRPCRGLLIGQQRVDPLLCGGQPVGGLSALLGLEAVTEVGDLILQDGDLGLLSLQPGHQLGP